MNEQVLLHKRQRQFVGRVFGAHFDWLHDQKVRFSLADPSKALRMVLDYVMQDLTEAELFVGSPAGSYPQESTDDERVFVLDVSHVQWLESATSKRGFLSASTLVDYVIDVVAKVDPCLIFEIERSHKRARDTAVRFSIKS